MTLLPGAALDPGAHWNGEAGWSSCLMEVWHFTVGRDSRALIRDQGLAAVLVWDDVVWQFAPLEAVCFTECEWNRRSIGVEVESLDGSLTPGQLANLGYVTLFCLTTFGIPQQFYDGPRLPLGYDYRGVTNHRNLVHNACDQHSDGFDQWVWDAITTPPPPPPKGDTMASFLVNDLAGRVWVLDVDAGTKTWVRSPTALNAHQEARKVVKFLGGWAVENVFRADENGGIWGQLLADARDVDEFNDVGTGSGGTGGATKADVQAIVAADGALTRTEVAKPRQLTGSVQ